ALAGRAFSQAQKFGAEVVIPAAVSRLDCSRPGDFALQLEDDGKVRARTVVIASGAEYRHPRAKALVDAATGGDYCDPPVRGSHLRGSRVAGALCSGPEVALVGGGNSAGQAAVYLASKAAKVWMLVRGAGLEATMSKYLIDRIKAQGNIELLTHTEVSGLTA